MEMFKSSIDNQISRGINCQGRLVYWLAPCLVVVLGGHAVACSFLIGYVVADSR